MHTPQPVTLRSYRYLPFQGGEGAGCITSWAPDIRLNLTQWRGRYVVWRQFCDRVSCASDKASHVLVAREHYKRVARRELSRYNIFVTKTRTKTKIARLRFRRKWRRIFRL